MKKEYAEEIMGKVKASYNAIGKEFDATRKQPWGEFEDFKKMVQAGQRVLDIGCGNGRLYEALLETGVDYLGVDTSQILIELATQNHPDARFEVGDMTQLDLPEESFDLIFSVAAFHHVPGRDLREKAVSEMHRLLKPGGKVALTVWNLYQDKYKAARAEAFWNWLLHLGRKYERNDLWIKWKTEDQKRYYHAFKPPELEGYFAGPGWKNQELYFVRQGKRTTFEECFNMILTAEKV